MKIVFLTKASPEIGFGHLNRCLVLSESIRHIGCEVALFVNDHSSTKSFAKNHTIQLSTYDSLEHLVDADCCIVDLYDYDSLFYETLDKKYKHVVIFDDYRFEVPTGVSGVINGNIYANNSLYTTRARIFAGVQYFLLRPEFVGQQQSLEAQNVLVCMGGSDPTNQTTRILDILSQVTKRPIDAIFGHGYDDIETLEKWTSHPQITNHLAVSNMSSLMKNAIFCVSGGGSMMYELAYMGIPTASLSLIDHQRLISETFAQKNASIDLGYFEEVDDQNIADQIQLLDTNKQIRNDLQDVSNTLVDGKGPQRLAVGIYNWLTQSA